jgi:hypothetical protein
MAIDGESRIHHASGPRQQQGLLSRTSSSNHLRGLPVVHKLQSARRHHVPTRTRLLIPREETYATFQVEYQQTEHECERLTLEVIGPIPLGRTICQQARFLARGANPSSRLILIPRSRSSLMLLVPHAKTSRLISRSILTSVRENEMTRLGDAQY